MEKEEDDEEISYVAKRTKRGRDRHEDEGGGRVRVKIQNQSVRVCVDSRERVLMSTRARPAFMTSCRPPPPPPPPPRCAQTHDEVMRRMKTLQQRAG